METHKYDYVKIYNSAIKKSRKTGKRVLVFSLVGEVE